MFGQGSEKILICKDLKAHEWVNEQVIKDDLPSKVDVVGYVDPNKRIKQMVEAGIRIDAWNHALYDFENGVEQDDGEKMASERDDWDDMDMLVDAGRQKELYRREMYSYYRKSLESQMAAQSAPQGPSGATEKQSETVEKSTSGE